MKSFLIGIFFLAANLFAQSPDPLTPARRIADKIITETSFTFTEAEQKPAVDLQVIDFKRAFNKINGAYAYAFANILAHENKILQFGISYSSPVKVLVNDRLIFTGKEQPQFYFKEIAYAVFTFQDTFRVNLNKGLNKIVIESPGGNEPVVYLREITGAEERPLSKFLPADSLIKNYTWPWCFYVTGNVNGEKLSADSLFDKITSDKYSCTVLKPAIIKKLFINSQNTFKKDSFADWNYPNGILMMTMAELSSASGDKTYGEFVKKYCNFIKENLPRFKKQYFEDHDLRGSFYRVFRKSMLDDAGSPTLPFAEVELEEHGNEYDDLINEMAGYIVNGQAKLPDGTLCRPEPVEWTVWADDLFMSVPLLVRLGALHNDEKYFNEASKQLINFNKYLYDKTKKLYKHGWFSTTNKKSNVFWGRANGWVVWATSEALKYIPKDNKSYKSIERIFVNHIEGILATQDKSGMWHQVLNDNNSFEETSCTAMFIIGISRGIMSGIVDKKYTVNILKAWNALQSKISSTGIVKDICCGTGIGPDKKFYETRERYNNDPRGLGAVIAAAVEVDKLGKYINKTK